MPLPSLLRRVIASIYIMLTCACTARVKHRLFVCVGHGRGHVGTHPTFSFLLLPSFVFCFLAVRAMHAAGREVLSQLASENSEQTGTKTEKLQTEPSGAEEQGQFKFGYHLPPFNSVHHLQ